MADADDVLEATARIEGGAKQNAPLCPQGVPRQPAGVAVSGVTLR
ncbi:hypothetical protein [Bradyrhizobium sp. ARR65]|nr:hypothetical protein [Bradyrhizobium sp. ARR65]